MLELEHHWKEKKTGYLLNIFMYVMDPYIQLSITVLVANYPYCPQRLVLNSFKPIFKEIFARISNCKLVIYLTIHINKHREKTTLLRTNEHYYLHIE